MAIKDGMMKMALNVVIRKINKRVNMSDVLSKYNADGRTMVVIITDLGENSGFSVANGKLVSGTIDDPTCMVSLTKNILGAILTNKITHQQAFLLGEVTVTSDERLRDGIVLNKIFDEMKNSIVMKQE